MTITHTARAEQHFINGLVYEGEWHNGLPHGRGTLNGGAVCDWFRGVCVVRGQTCRCLNQGTNRRCRGDADCDASATVGEWHYTGQLAPRPAQDPTDYGGGRGAGDDLVLGCRMSGRPLSDEWGTQNCPVPHGFGTATYANGTVITASWNGGYHERGTCRTADGAVFDGYWTPHNAEGFGRIQWPSGTSTRCTSWSRHYPYAGEYGDYPEAHRHALCKCPPTTPYDPRHEPTTLV